MFRWNSNFRKIIFCYQNEKEKQITNIAGRFYNIALGDLVHIGRPSLLDQLKSAKGT